MYKDVSAYRKKIYNSYFENQVQRYEDSELKEKIKSNFHKYDEEILPCLPTNKSIKILDLGCGYGSLISWLRSKGYENVEGIDISPDQVEMAQSVLIPNIYMEDAFEYLENKKEEYDVIFGIDIIEHFTKVELEELLTKIHKSLKKGGMTFFRTPNIDSPFSSTIAYGDYTHETLLNYFSSEQLLLSLGFKNLRIKPASTFSTNFLKKILQVVLWQFILVGAKTILFASGRSIKKVVFTPNILICGYK